MPGERVLFERASGEMEQVPGPESDRQLFDRINQQLDRIVDGIDAAGGLSQSLEVQLNEITYRSRSWRRFPAAHVPDRVLRDELGGWWGDRLRPVFWLLGVGGA